ncbi:unnamed protein product [Dibothriocephalus latus]|uniref:Receptor ligand binding region domain-containing protein n=1 Tax=Dibothriocephalus latus TaxID=60516 RepID=A0A3P7LRW7_DIBLA|nr:unnamed protein product [Dibothriocephalus latus]
MFTLLKEGCAQMSYKLQLVRLDVPQECLQEFKIFDLRATVDFVIFHATAGLDEQLTASDVKEFALTVNGCCLWQSVHERDLLSALKEADDLASFPNGFTVLIASALPSDCNFLTDWIQQGDIADLEGLYQIHYNCRLNKLVQPPVHVNISYHLNDSAADLITLSMTIQLLTLATSLNIFLRHYGWQQIAFFYEVSHDSLQMMLVAQQLQVFFTSLSQSRIPLKIVALQALRGTSEAASYLNNLPEPIDGKLGSSFYEIDKDVVICRLLAAQLKAHL